MLMAMVLCPGPALAGPLAEQLVHLNPPSQPSIAVGDPLTDFRSALRARDTATLGSNLSRGYENAIGALHLRMTLYRLKMDRTDREGLWPSADRTSGRAADFLLGTDLGDWGTLNASASMLRLHRPRNRVDFDPGAHVSNFASVGLAIAASKGPSLALEYTSRWVRRRQPDLQRIAELQSDAPSSSHGIQVRLTDGQEQPGPGALCWSLDLGMLQRTLPLARGVPWAPDQRATFAVRMEL